MLVTVDDNVGLNSPHYYKTLYTEKTNELDKLTTRYNAYCRTLSNINTIEEAYEVTKDRELAITQIKQTCMSSGIDCYIPATASFSSAVTGLIKSVFESIFDLLKTILELIRDIIKAVIDFIKSIFSDKGEKSSGGGSGGSNSNEGPRQKRVGEYRSELEQRKHDLLASPDLLNNMLKRLDANIELVEKDIRTTYKSLPGMYLIKKNYKKDFNLESIANFLSTHRKGIIALRQMKIDDPIMGALQLNNPRSKKGIGTTVYGYDILPSIRILMNTTKALYSGKQLSAIDIRRDVVDNFEKLILTNNGNAIPIVKEIGSRIKSITNSYLKDMNNSDIVKIEIPDDFYNDVIDILSDNKGVANTRFTMLGITGNNIYGIRLDNPEVTTVDILDTLDKARGGLAAVGIKYVDISNIVKKDGTITEMVAECKNMNDAFLTTYTEFYKALEQFTKLVPNKPVKINILTGLNLNMDEIDNINIDNNINVHTLAELDKTLLTLKKDVTKSLDDLKGYGKTVDITIKKLEKDISSWKKSLEDIDGKNIGKDDSISMKTRPLLNSISSYLTSYSNHVGSILKDVTSVYSGETAEIAKDIVTMNKLVNSLLLLNFYVEIKNSSH